jgi:hypothetical protein
MRTTAHPGKRVLSFSYGGLLPHSWWKIPSLATQKVLVLSPSLLKNFYFLKSACAGLEGILREGTPGPREEFRVAIAAVMSQEKSKAYTFTRQILYDLAWSEPPGGQIT